MFARFFIDRPIFASVISILIVIIGGISYIQLPQAQYPDVAPPVINITASFPGADAKTVSETVAIPIEEKVNGVENMLYLESVCTNDGGMQINVTFNVGMDIDMALVLVQNRVALATSILPETVKRIGVTTKKRSPSLLMSLCFYSDTVRPESELKASGIDPEEWEYKYDPLYISNFIRLRVKDTIARAYGVGDAVIWGEKEYSMRVWLDPEKMGSRGLSAGDVTKAIAAQNVQVAAGQLGRSPIEDNVIDYQYSLRAYGRLLDEEEFGKIVVKTDDEGRKTYLRDVSRIVRGAKEMDVVSYNNGRPCVSFGVFQLPGTNAIQTAHGVREIVAELEKDFPEGLKCEVTFDTTPFIEESLHEVQNTLRDAIILVAVVVLLFLQSWRATLIPLLAVPVSLVGTFAVMGAFGFSLNSLSLFGLVLAIGIVVDDAIVVVECVERHMEDGLSPKEATRKAMDEVSGALVAIALVLSCVFIPCAFLPGVTGQFFRQFALTIAVSTIISCFNSLTLSPAMAGLVLRSKGASRDWLTLAIDYTLGIFIFKPFNWCFGKLTSGYVWIVKQFLRLSFVVLALYVGLLYMTAETFQSTPTGFIPQQDRGFLLAMVQLPDSASASRTREAIAKMQDGALAIDGLQSFMSIEGLSFITNSKAPNMASIWIVLDPFEERKKTGVSDMDVLLQLRKVFEAVPEAVVNVFPPAPVDGMGSSVGFTVQFEDKNDYGVDVIQQMLDEVSREANQTPGLQRCFTQYRSAVPQMFINIDREKAYSRGVEADDIFEALQTYLGTVYVNDMTFVGRNFQVNVQADARFRLHPEDLNLIKVKSRDGAMVPLGSLLTVENSYGPLSVNRYNMYPAAPLLGEAAPGTSSGESRKLMAQVMEKILPQGMDYEWTSLALLEERAGNDAIYVFFIAILFVFLVLAAQYESWALPLAVILVVPMCLLASLTGVNLMGMDMNIFTQIGFLVLVGLASKNAILIVEFARERREAGLSRHEATLTACRLRLRPIIMTSMAFILGVVPLLVSTGAGAEMRRVLGVAVFSGMLGVTIFGIFLTPVFFNVVEMFFGKKK